MTQTVCHLFEAPGHRPVVANWIYEAFWFEMDGYSPEHFESRLGEAKDRDGIPLSLLARQLLQEAARLNCPAVYLETHIPDFYKRLGAGVQEEVADDFWLLRIATKA